MEQRTDCGGIMWSKTLILMLAMKYFKRKKSNKRNQKHESQVALKGALPDSPSLPCPPRPNNRIFRKENRHFHTRNFSTMFFFSIFQRSNNEQNKKERKKEKKKTFFYKKSFFLKKREKHGKKNETTKR